ncbi:WXG100 family type VII secretion target [Nocardioides solisilvae]|uniref:WXG100 family type VII secretion target n=1 Tax=Nocardioides solisilvae TaxID=1542435 RepID=UPI000D74E132|nr:WXG100 family type VII secretion target [Nocardioides solisilvae]
MSIGLEYAELQSAATTVVEGIAPLQDLLTGLGGSLEASSAGFRGQAAGAFAEAVGAWFEVATTLGPILEGYASAIMAVAQEHAANDRVQTQAYQQLAGRLGGAQ